MNLKFKVRKNIDVVFEHLTDMTKFSSVHPIISKIVKIDQDRYKIHETIKFGFIPFPFTYSAKITADDSRKTVIMNAVVFKLTKIELKFTLSQEDDDTIVNEEISFSTPFPIKFMLRKIFREQHARLFENLETV